MVTCVFLIVECVKVVIIKRLGYWNKNRQTDRTEIDSHKHTCVISHQW